MLELCCILNTHAIISIFSVSTCYLTILQWVATSKFPYFTHIRWMFALKSVKRGWKAKKEINDIASALQPKLHVASPAGCIRVILSRPKAHIHICIYSYFCSCPPLAIRTPWSSFTCTSILSAPGAMLLKYCCIIIIIFRSFESGTCNWNVIET